MKKAGIILLTLGIILIAGSFAFKESSNEKPSKKEKPKEETIVDKVNKVLEDYILSDNNTFEKLKEVTNDKFDTTVLLFGKDSYISRKPSDTVIKDKNLDKYEEQQNKYMDKIKKRFKSKIKYEGKESVEGNIEYEIVPWYYIQYITDLMYIKNKIIPSDFYNISEEESLIYDYKAKVIAMKVLDNYLKDYDETEKSSYIFFMENGNPKENQYLGLYNTIAGNSGKKFNASERMKEVEKYYEKALIDGVIDANDKLNLK